MEDEPSRAPCGRVLDRCGSERDEGVAHILPFEEGCEDKAIGQCRRHVLAGMDAEIDLTGFERRFDFLAEETLAADFAEGGIGEPVTRCGDHADIDFGLGDPVNFCQEPAHQMGLHQGQLAAARSDPQKGW